MGPNILLVGCGKMGGAMLTGWIDRKLPGDVVVVEPAVASAAPFKDRKNVYVTRSLEAVTEHFKPDVVVFAVKPQSMDEVVPAYARFSRLHTAFLSIAAGKTIAYFQEKLGRQAAVVRAMPNTPAAIGRGMTVLCSNANIGPSQMALTQALMEAVGETAWVGDERLMDAVTAVSGSGPAYVFLLIECLTEAGIRAGLPKTLAQQCARATVSGAGELARLAREPADALRQNVTSPGGTTAAALAVLMSEDGLQQLMTRAVAAATERSRELAG